MHFLDIKNPDSVGSRSEEAHTAGVFHPLHLHHVSLHHDCLGPALAWEGSIQGKVHGEVRSTEECQALLPTAGERSMPGLHWVQEPGVQIQPALE